MSSRRVERLNEQLKREIAELLRKEIRDPRIGRPTVTGVEVTPDLYSARVHVQLDREGEEARVAMTGLRAASAFIRKELAGTLHVRRVPELRFEEDRTLEQAMRIEEILREVLPDDGSTDDESGELAGGEETDEPGQETS